RDGSSEELRREGDGGRFLQRRIESAKECDAVRHLIHGTVTKSIVGQPRYVALAAQMGEVAVPRDVAQADHHTQPCKQGDLLVEPACAVRQLGGRRLVAGWRAAADGGD